jgi:prepilin-type N-terminal cleavage/methylation domain-containing protein
MNRQGFTLIELMVVIVIIGVLASLAIPRFTEASSKAKAAEAPRVLSSYETAFLAAAAELGEENVKETDMIFEVAAVNNDSKWFTYEYKDIPSAPEVPCTPEALEADPDCKSSPAIDGVKGMFAASQSKLGKAEKGAALCTQPASNGAFSRGGDADLLKLIPNFRVQDNFTCPAS